MKNEPHIVKSRVWLWEGKGAWHFITIEKDQSQKIKNDYIWPRRGFGSIPVNITIGKTTWKTSIFPYKNSTYILPIKKSVRDKEDIVIGQKLSFSLQVIF